MRDLLLTLVIAACLPAILLKPQVGAYVWAWLSLMNPHRLTFGFAYAIPFAMIVAVVTLLASLQSRKRHSFPLNPLTALYICFVVWMSFTSLFALNTPEIVYDRWVQIMKIHLMMFLTLTLVRGRRQIETLIGVVTLSLAYYGIKGGIFTVLTAGAYRVWGPPSSFVEGNNELAVALVVLIPFMVYLYSTTPRRVVRWFMAASALTCGVAILGSHSRGALLALAAMAVFLGLKGKRPIVYTAALVFLLATGVSLMPEVWSSRMDTIVHYQEEASAMSRIYIWKTMWALALDRPITGAGFATDSMAVFSRYAPPEYFELFGGALWVAHSVYFQALGEHGFPGLALYVALGVLTWRRAGRLVIDTKSDPEFREWVPLLMKAVQVSLLGFAVGGAFLSLVHFDLPYYMIIYVLLVEATVSLKRETHAVAGSVQGSARSGALT
jgi:probable O-glycosylation ligase (exosortase A-associated)